MTPNLNIKPDIKISIKQSFGFDSNMEVQAFSKKNELVPEIDKNYKFDRDTTLAILSGFAFNKRVLVQGYHGTGKSTHIEQIAARLNWPCVRINFDAFMSLIALIIIVLYLHSGCLHGSLSVSWCSRVMLDEWLLMQIT